MLKKIFLTILSFNAISLLICFALLFVIMYANIMAERRTFLKNELALAAVAVEREGMAYLEGLPRQNLRLTLVNPQGKVIFDSVAKTDSMDNHATRPEIQQARVRGFGESQHRSATLMEDTLYSARLLANGDVLRISISEASALNLLLGMTGPALAIILLGALLSLLPARKLAGNIVDPLTLLDLDKPLENDAYPELAPILRRLNQQQKEIGQYLADLRQRTREFEQITSSMDEGLTLLDSALRIASINPAARAIFQIPSECGHSSFPGLARQSRLREAMEKALASGQHQIFLNRDKRIFQIKIKRIDKEGAVAGLALLALDVTSQKEIERKRREFSANVSHELKTPLQTIIGSAEMLENGIVKPEDIKAFSQKIHKEGLRLLNLVNDILHLSRLDEHSPLPATDFDLYPIVEACARHFRKAARLKNIDISVSGESAEIHGVPSLAEEIVYNLCENAVKYNRINGQVEMAIERQENGITLIVKDTGIGIPEDEQDLIFERFYRVDKSHSRERGGTGLGLSIVKHAAKIFNARIEVRSEPGQGTSFKVLFPFGDASSQAEEKPDNA